MFYRRFISIICIAWAVMAQANEDKVSRSVRRLAEEAGPDGRVRVFVLGTYQPQEQINQQWAAVMGRQIEAEERALEGLTRHNFAVDGAVDLARERRDAAVTGLRREAARHVRAEIQPQQNRLLGLLERAGARSTQEFTAINMVAADIPVSAINALAADGDVGRIVANQQRRFHLDISTQAMHATDLWVEGITGDGEAVAVLDSGIRSNHEMFAGKQVIHRPFIDASLSLLDRFDARDCLAEKPETGEDKNGHGTHVAGIIAGSGSKRYPTLRGVGRGVTKIYNLKIGVELNPDLCSPSTLIHDQDWMAAIQWAVTETPVRIFNMSFGAPGGDDENEDLLVDQIADNYNAILVISAGNEGPNPRTVSNPGNAYNILSVAARDDRRTMETSDDGIADFSSRGPTESGRFKPDIAAPGARITSADSLSGAFRDLSGTSMAAPHITGAVALLSQAGIKDNIAVKALMINSADQRGWRYDRGWGFANVRQAWEMKDRILRFDLQPGRPVTAARYWRARLDEPFRATMVWNRHVGQERGVSFSKLRELDMYLFDRATGEVVAKSAEPGQNVEQIATDYRGEVILKVTPASAAFEAAGSPERVAIAATRLGWEPVAGPRLEVSCQALAAAAAAGEFEVNCTAANDGGLPVRDVRGALSVPVGFKTSGIASFGTVDPGQRVSRRYKVSAGAAAGEFLGFQAGLTGSSFGDELSASSAPLTVTVASAALPTISASPASIQLTWRMGDADPAPVTLTIQAPAPLVYHAALQDANWLSTPSPLRGSLPDVITLLVRPRGLAEGSYRGEVMVTAGMSNATLIVPVMLTVTGTGASVVETRMSKTLAQGCASPAAALSFAGSDDKAWLWTRVVGARSDDKIRVEWVGPSGNVFRTQAPAGLGQSGETCHFAALDIAGTSAAVTFGEWSARVSINDGRVVTEKFFIAPVRVEAAGATRAASLTGCTDPEFAREFSGSDSAVTMWMRVTGGRERDVASVTWFGPDGRAVDSRFFPARTSDAQACLAASLAMRPGLARGEWKAVGYWNNSPVVASRFTIR